MLFQGGAVSRWRKNKLGVPLGAVSSPSLWDFFTADLDETGFADDFHGISESPDVDQVNAGLNEVGGRMLNWAVKNDMSILAPKSTATLFNP